MKTSPNPFAQEQSAANVWNHQLRSVGSAIETIAREHAPLDALNGVGEPVEVYQATAGGNYRILHAFADGRDHIEIDCFPPSPDLQNITNDPEMGKPIMRLTASVPQSTSPDELPDFTIEHDYGVNGGQPNQNIELAADVVDTEGINKLWGFIGKAQTDLIKPARKDINLAHVREVVSNHRLADTYSLLFVDGPETNKDTIAQRQAIARQTAEQEIARTALIEINAAQVQITRTKHEMPSGEVQRKRMQGELQELHKRNAEKQLTPKIVIGGRGAGREHALQPKTATAIARRGQHVYEDRLEIKIPAEGLTAVPKDHLVVFIASPMNILHRQSYRNLNSIVAVADDATEFARPFFAWEARSFEDDPKAVDISFETPSPGLIKSRVDAKIKQGIRENQYAQTIERAMLIGLGDNVAVPRTDTDSSVEYLVSNVEGELHVDGKPLSSLQVKRLESRLDRLVDNVYGDRLVNAADNSHSELKSLSS